VIESAPTENQAPTASSLKQCKTGDLIQLEIKVHEITKLALAKFGDFDLEFVNANIVSHKCEKQVMEKVNKAIAEAKELIKEMNSIDQQAYFSVYELLYLRLKIMVAQRMEVEELETLTKEKQYFLMKEQELRDQLVAEMAQMKSRLKHGELKGLGGCVGLFVVMCLMCACAAELAGSTKELHRQLDEIKLRRDKINSARVQEALLMEEAKRPGRMPLWCVVGVGCVSDCLFVCWCALQGPRSRSGARSCSGWRGSDWRRRSLRSS
jgi:hypothetical protein